MPYRLAPVAMMSTAYWPSAWAPMTDAAIDCIEYGASRVDRLNGSLSERVQRQRMAEVKDIFVLTNWPRQITAALMGEENELRRRKKLIVPMR